MSSAGLMLACVIYAGVRYHAGKGVPLDQFPLFIVNKALSLFALLGYAAAHATNPARRLWPGLDYSLLNARSPMLALATGSLAMHIILSLLLMRPEYFPVVFNGSVFSLSGGVSLLAGSMGAVIVASIVHRCTAPHAARMSTALKRSASAALLLMGVHAGLLGWENWFGAAWPAGMPPITLIAVLAVLAAFVLRAVARFYSTPR